MSTTSVDLPVDPKAIRRMEKDIEKEAKADEKDCQQALKELQRTEKSEAKASKVSRSESLQGIR